jgi:hypothetical protein
VVIVLLLKVLLVEKVVGALVVDETDEGVDVELALVVDAEDPLVVVVDVAEVLDAAEVGVVVMPPTS